MRFQKTERCAAVHRNVRCERKRIPGMLFCVRCRCESKDSLGRQCQRGADHTGAHKV